jgi:hypothetical protein
LEWASRTPKEIALNQEHSALSSNRLASRRLNQALNLLHRASRQLEAASQSAPDRFHKDENVSFALGLRGIGLLLGRVALRLERGAQ